VPMARKANKPRSDEMSADREPGRHAAEHERGVPSTPHVLHVFQPQTGGVPSYVSAVTRGLLGRGWRVSVACDPGSSMAGDLRAAGAEVVPLQLGRSPRVLRDACAVGTLARWCREHGVGVIHGHSTKAGLLAALTGRCAGIPSVYTPHGWAFEMRVAPPLRMSYALLERQLTHRFHARVVTVSAAGRAAAERWRVAPRGRIEVVRTGLPQTAHAPDRQAARRQLGLAPDAFVAAWVGRVGEPKRPRDVARIARRLGAAVTVVVLCEGIHEHPLADRLRATGVVLAGPECEPATVYAAADVLLHTSDWEGCPLVVLEAMAAKLPVVAYRVGGLSEQVSDGGTGHLVDRGDVEAMCDRALALARDTVTRERMGEAAQERVADVFSYPSMLGRLMSVYLAAAGPARAGRPAAGALRERRRGGGHAATVSELPSAESGSVTRARSELAG
jgi:glycosyltransferase involved in cell wall biosynthesis